MANQFGGPSASQSFLTGLAASTMDAFKQDHDKQESEDSQKKQIDYQLLMRAMDHINKDDSLTPSQRNAATQEIMNRSLDIFKPKGHSGIKDKLKGLFGGDQPYQPQGVGSILTSAGQRPKAQVQAPVETGPGIRPRTVTMPAPPQSELTYREQDIQDEATKQRDILNRQMMVEAQRDEARRNQRKEQNTAILERFKTENDIKDDAKATLKLRERAAIFGDPDDPTNQERARISLQQELEQKKQESQQKIEVQRTRIKQINEAIVNARTRIAQSAAKLGIAQSKRFNDDPQVKGAWKKVDEYKSEAQRLRTQAAIVYGKGDSEQADSLNRQAESAETAMQGVINNIEQRIQQMGGVKLPSAPSAGGRSVKRSDINARAAKEGLSPEVIIQHLPKGTRIVD